MQVLLFTTCTAIRMKLLQLCFLMLKIIVLYKDANQIVSLTHTVGSLNSTIQCVGYKTSFE